MSDFGELQDDGAGVAHGLCANLDHSISQNCQRPVRYCFWKYLRAQEIGQIVRQCIKLKPDFIGFEALAGKSPAQGTH